MEQLHTSNKTGDQHRTDAEKASLLASIRYGLRWLLRKESHVSKSGPFYSKSDPFYNADEVDLLRDFRKHGMRGVGIIGHIEGMLPTPESRKCPEESGDSSGRQNS